MPLRMVLDDGAVLAKHVALVGARNLDPPEVEFIEASGHPDGRGRGRAGARGRRRRLRGARRRLGRARRARRVHARAGRAARSTRSRSCCATSPRARGSPARLHRARARRRRTSRSSPGSRARWGCRPPAVTVAGEARSKLPRWPTPRSTSRSSTSRLPSRRRRSIPNTCPSCGSHYRDDELVAQPARLHRSAAITSRSRRASGSRSSPTRAASSRRPPTSARPIRSASSTCAPTTSGSRRRRSRPGSATRS